MSEPDNMHIRSYVERIRTIENEIAEKNDDKADIYAEVRGNGYNVKALRKLIARMRRPKSEREIEDDEVDLMEAAYVRAGGVMP